MPAGEVGLGVTGSLADRAGRATVRVERRAVRRGRVWGTYTTTLRALTSGVGAEVRFSVVRRCPSGITSCA